MSKLIEFAKQYGYLVIAALLIIQGLSHWTDQWINTENSPAMLANLKKISSHQYEWERVLELRNLNQVDSSSVQNPFHAQVSPPTTSQSQKLSPPKRGLSLKGITNGSSALMATADGNTAVIQVGESIGNAQLIELGNNYAKLRDKFGEFQLVIDN